MSVQQPMLKRHPVVRRLPIGAEVLPGGVHFRVWAPDHDAVEVVLDTARPAVFPLEPDTAGYFEGFVPEVGAGTRYRFRLSGKGDLYPDPASRYQPEGPNGPSEVVDAATFTWTDAAWMGLSPEHQVLYEMHFGTFTRAGTYRSAEEHLAYLADLGITCLEVMPVAEFAGRFNWGYDGVDQFAPAHVYGTPEDLRHFIDTAHAHGIGVILDVVYNHLGPVGNYLPAFTKRYFSEKHQNDWGQPLNFDGPDAHGVREFFLSNVKYWVQEFHVDGFRFDATQALLDESPEHICAAISRRAREAAGHRKVLLVNENEPQHARLVRPIEKGGMGMDALWNDDFHHVANVALTGHAESYYMDYTGSPQEFLSCAKYGYLYQGQRYLWQEMRRGTPAFDLPPYGFINYLQNHDQIANSGRGLRLHDLTSPQQFRAITALTLLMPQTPMVFQGQEFAASSPYHYFADHEEELSKLVRQGRRKELSQFPTIATPAMQEQLANPAEEKIFENSKIDHNERHQPQRAKLLLMFKDLLRLRREDGILCRVQKRGDLDGAVLGDKALVLRYFGPEGDDRLVICNYGADLKLTPAPEPLLAPPEGKRWAVLFHTEHPKYDGAGMPHPETEQEGWLLLGRCTAVLKPVPIAEGEVQTRIVKPGKVEGGRRPVGEP